MPRIYFGHDVAAYIAPARRAAILDVISVVVIYVVNNPFFAEILNRSAVIFVEAVRPDDALLRAYFAPVFGHQPVRRKAVGRLRLARAFFLALVAGGGFGRFLGAFLRPGIRFVGDAHRDRVLDRLRHRGVL
jgi:hypothetical protein